KTDVRMVFAAQGEEFAQEAGAVTQRAQVTPGLFGPAHGNLLNGDARAAQGQPEREVEAEPVGLQVGGDAVEIGGADEFQAALRIAERKPEQFAGEESEGGGGQAARGGAADVLCA